MEHKPSIPSMKVGRPPRAAGAVRTRPTRPAEAVAVDGRLQPRQLRSTYNRLQLVGLSASEAGNLIAHLVGLRVSRQGWTVLEIERLLFIRSLALSGRLE
jgi:hypothetical protein